MSKDSRRIVYASPSHTLMGLWLVQFFNQMVILVFSILGMIGVWLAQTLPDVRTQTDEES